MFRACGGLINLANQRATNHPVYRIDDYSLKILSEALQKMRKTHELYVALPEAKAGFDKEIYDQWFAQCAWMLALMMEWRIEQGPKHKSEQNAKEWASNLEALERCLEGFKKLNALHDGKK